MATWYLTIGLLAETPSTHPPCLVLSARECVTVTECVSTRFPGKVKANTGYLCTSLAVWVGPAR